MRVALRWKLFFSLVVPAVGLGLVIVLLSAHWLRERAVENFRQEQTFRTAALANRIDDRLVELMRVGAKTAETLTSQGSVTEVELYDMLRRIVDHDAKLSAAGALYKPYRFSPLMHEFSPFVVRSLAGVSENPPDGYGQVLLDSQWYRQVVESGSPIWSEPARRDGVDGDFIARFAMPFGQDESNVDGAVVLAIPAGSMMRLAVPGFEVDEALALVSARGRILTSTSEFLSVGTDLEGLAERALRPAIADLTSAAGASGSFDIESLETAGAAWLLHARIPSTGWTVIRIVPVERVLAFPSAQLRRAGFALMLLAALLTALMFAVSSHITGPMRRLSNAAEQLGTGDFSVRVSGIESHDETGDLARAFNAMVMELEVRVDELTRATAAKEAVEGELRAARRIQAALLPSSFPPFPDNDEFELFAVNAPAAEVGGDFFDFFFIDPNQLVFVIADVSGKGVPAAMLMAVSRTIVRNLAGLGHAPETILDETNRLLLADNIRSMCLTLFVGIYDIRSGVCRYANGAHPPALRVSASGEVSTVGHATGTLVGILEDVQYTGDSIVLEVGDLLVLYTDGLTEARAADGRFYGDAPLMRLLKAYSDAPAHFLCELIEREVNAHQGGDRSDDLTLLLLRRRS